jgi:outer membrane biosynthesis protein TonB
MSVAVANTTYPSLKRYMKISVILHALLIGLMVASALLKFPGNQWAGAGGGGDNVKVNLVGSAGIPMPKEPQPTESNVVDPAKTLHKEEEKPKPPPEPPTPAQKIPQFEKNKPLPPTHKSKVFEKKTPEPENAVPGRGGTPTLPTGVGSTPGSSPGLSIQGQGGGDFATRYGWYIDAARRRVLPNWNKNSLSAGLQNNRTLHCSIAFTIARDGTIKNPRVSETSGNSLWDNAGLRAILDSNPLPALPSDYNYPEVSVIWDFPERGHP